MATTAIAGDAKIRWYNTARIQDVHVTCLRDRAGILLHATIAAESLHDYQTRQGTLELAVTSPDGGSTLRETKNALLRSGRNYVEFRLLIREPRLWWPNGLGDPSLYTIQATLTVANETFAYPPSDNYFDLLPGQERTVDISCTGPSDVNAVRLTSVT